MIKTHLFRYSKKGSFDETTYLYRKINYFLDNCQMISYFFEYSCGKIT